MQKNIIYLLILTILTFFLFIHNIAIQQSIINACQLFLTNVFPSLFPMFIISDLMIYFRLPELLCQIFGKLFSKYFHTSPYGAFAFFTSLFCGTPANAYIIKNLIIENKINLKEASYILSFSFFNNPLFLFTMYQNIFPNNYQIIIKLLIIPYLVNLIIAFILKPKETTKKSIIFKTNNKQFSDILIESIKQSMNTMLIILGTITVFFILNKMINPTNIPFISGILEISQGLNNLKIANLTIKTKELLAILFTSFGGLSIHLQIKSIFKDTKISFKLFFIARFLQCILSILLIFL